MTNRLKCLLCLLLAYGLACSLPAQDTFRKSAVFSIGPGLNTGGFFQGYGGYGKKMPQLAISVAVDYYLGLQVCFRMPRSKNFPDN